MSILTVASAAVLLWSNSHCESVNLVASIKVKFLILLQHWTSNVQWNFDIFFVCFCSSPSNERLTGDLRVLQAIVLQGRIPHDFQRTEQRLKYVAKWRNGFLTSFWKHAKEIVQTLCAPLQPFYKRLERLRQWSKYNSRTVFHWNG